MNKNIHCQPRVLITGASGFIGSNLTNHLLNLGWDVHAVSRNHSRVQNQNKRCTLHTYDGQMDSMNQIIKSSRPDLVIHLASLFLSQHNQSDVDQLITSNILFGTHLLESMAQHGVKHLINTGTSWQHFHNEDFNPVNLYAATKQAFEDIIAYYVEAHAFSVSTLSLFDTYGPGDTRKKLIPMLLNALVTGEELLMSPGEQLIDLLYIDDVVQAFTTESKALLEREKGKNKFGLSSENR